MQCKHYGCTSPAEDGKMQCRPHLDASRDYQNRRRRNLLREGKCTRCGGTPRPGKTMCQVCADKWNGYLRSRRLGKT